MLPLVSLAILISGTFARGDLAPPGTKDFGGLPKPGAAAATAQCLKILVRATERTDIDVLQNGDLAIHTDQGLRIEKSSGRHATIDANGNCSGTNLSGRLFDKNAFNAIVLAGYKRLEAKDAVSRICAQSDRQVLKDLVRPSTLAPNLIPSPAAH